MIYIRKSILPLRDSIGSNPITDELGLARVVYGRIIN